MLWGGKKKNIEKSKNPGPQDWGKNNIKRLTFGDRKGKKGGNEGYIPSIQ